MTELFNYDVRVRERMLRRGAISDSELAKHLDALPDLEGRFDELALRQPALQRGDEPAGPRTPSAIAPRSVPPASPPSTEDLDEEWGEDS